MLAMDVEASDRPSQSSGDHVEQVSAIGEDDSLAWRLFLAALDDDAGLAALFPESEDDEYSAHEEEMDSEELRNDRAVHIPRKEVNEIKRLADKALVPRAEFIPSQLTIDPAILDLAGNSRKRYLLGPNQRSALCARVRDTVQLAANLATRVPVQSSAILLVETLWHMAEESWIATAAPFSRSSLFTLEMRKTLYAALLWVQQPKSMSGQNLPRGRKGADRRSFMPVEDRLLVWGLKRFCADGVVARNKWPAIREFCLPVYETKQIHLRYKNQCARGRGHNVIKEWRIDMGARSSGPCKRLGRFELETLADSDAWEVELVVDDLDTPSSDRPRSCPPPYCYDYDLLISDQEDVECQWVFETAPAPRAAVPAAPLVHGAPDPYSEARLGRRRRVSILPRLPVAGHTTTHYTS